MLIDPVPAEKLMVSAETFPLPKLVKIGLDKQEFTVYDKVKVPLRELFSAVKLLIAMIYVLLIAGLEGGLIIKAELLEGNTMLKYVGNVTWNEAGPLNEVPPELLINVNEKLFGVLADIATIELTLLCTFIVDVLLVIICCALNCKPVNANRNKIEIFCKTVFIVLKFFNGIGNEI